MQHPPPSPGTTGLGNRKLLQLDGCTRPRIWWGGRDAGMLPPVLAASVQHGLSPLSAIRESTWESSLVEFGFSELLRCSVPLRKND